MSICNVGFTPVRRYKDYVYFALKGCSILGLFFVFVFWQVVLDLSFMLESNLVINHRPA